MARQLERKKFYRMKPPPSGQRNMLVAPYEIVLHAGHQTAVLGRFSHGLLPKVSFLHHPDDRNVLKIGAFCEANDAQIIVGGEHRNASLFNHTFGGAHFATFKGFMPVEDRDFAQVDRSRPVVIGNNVLLSNAATVLSGASIADGCVVGASALMVGATEPCGIYGGTPARRLKDRFDTVQQDLYAAARFWDIMAHQLPLIPGTLKRLASGEITPAEYAETMMFLPATPQVHFNVTFTQQVLQLGDPTAYSLGDRPITDAVTVRKLQDYLTQSPKNGEIQWTPDIFDALGLYD